jgi:hypothetical protein
MATFVVYFGLLVVQGLHGGVLVVSEFRVGLADLDGVEAAIGDTTAQVYGEVGTRPQHRVQLVLGDELLVACTAVVGLDLEVFVIGRDVQQLHVRTRFADVPVQPRHAQKYVHFDVDFGFIVLEGCETHNIIDPVFDFVVSRFVLLLEDCVFEFMDLMPKVLSDILNTFEEGDGESFTPVMYNYQCFKFLYVL